MLEFQGSRGAGCRAGRDRPALSREERLYDPAIHSALQAGEFRLHYLPTVRLEDGRCVGAEALIRWRRDGVWVPPMDFMPDTERTPLAGLITYWVIDTVAAELKDWLRAHPAAHVSINVPPDVLGRGGLEYAAVKSGLSEVRGQVVVEVTERGVPDEQGLMALDQMARDGVRVALDDVRLNGANLALLSRCHFEVIKLDQQLVQELRPGAPAPQWLQGLRALLAATRLEVVAEGVEREAQRELLAQAGVTLGQGHLFSDALPAAEFMAWYARHGADA
jgi:sensor c-di-GMP phosphodiesterase-like protein